MDVENIVTSTPDGVPVTYEPWTDGRAVGYKITSGDRVEFLYLNPSNTDDGDDVPNVFLYHGTHGDPSLDGADHHYLVLEPLPPG